MFRKVVPQGDPGWRGDDVERATGSSGSTVRYERPQLGIPFYVEIARRSALKQRRFMLPSSSPRISPSAGVHQWDLGG